MGVPSRLGRYVVRRRLGSGGFATVWLAHDEQLDAEVAVKVLADNWAHDDSVRRRFLEEGRFLRRVESEHVVQVHDVGELEDGRPFLVLTYADRGTLADRLKKEPLPLEPAIGVIVQVGRGLQALHRRGLLHRDVKPANVLFRSTDDDGERAVLSDLGLGKSLDEVSRITMPGGTPSYVAPEQALGERLDQRADQYSLGAVAYAALTGRSPHQVDGLGAAGRVKAAPPPSSLGFDVPERVDAAIVRALDPDRQKRWPDIESFTRELVGGLDETTQIFGPDTVAGAAMAALMTTPVATIPAPLPASPSTAPPTGEPDEAEDGEKTALSESNAPTVIGTGTATVPADAAGAPIADPATPAAAAAGTGTPNAGAPGAQTTATADAADAATASPPPSVQHPSPQPPRRRGRWVVAALLALILGAGGGFGVERYLETIQTTKVARDNFSVELPRKWASVVTASVWRPPGAAADRPAFRVSKDDRWNLPGNSTPGVFVGAMNDAADPVLALPDAGSYGCGSVGPVQTVANGPGRIVIDQISENCSNGTTLLQRVVDTGADDSVLIQVQVPGSERAKAVEVADSVTFSS
ncbi:serine/threonine-protein kinase [Kribbella sp. CA-293567]|uniref:serine/threonine-protein kinase n=1 Tax=Kribbella sp. CA-293567 TaxID=3002436 RepID=UPI0022DD0814|nr:serine/threonine-protein kinase [Kribbella sp. CA-293567]WBQ05942.1 serine/threonine-protein kinase [Kribbella sp. CA-293567]